MDQRKDEWRPWTLHTGNLQEMLLKNFTGRPRPVPMRPLYSRTSTIIIRKQVLPFYYAIYDHDLQRFVELQYRHGAGGTLQHLAVPADMQPPPESGT